MKKAISIFIVTALIFSVSSFSLTVNADYINKSGTIGDCTWTLTGDSSRLSLYVSGKGQISSFSSYSNTPWASYGKVIRVSIGSGITRIGSYAFNTSSITHVGLPGSIESVAPYAFYSGSSTINTVSYGGCENAWNALSVSSSTNYALKFAKISTYSCTGSWKITKEPTCTTTGSKTRTCDYCGTRTQSIAALGHTCNDWTIDTEPTCTEVGCKFGTCTVCGLKTEKDIDTIPCNGEWVIESIPSCIEDGFKTKTCGMCASKQEKIIPATGHNMGIWLTSNIVNCEKTTQNHRTCNNCDFRETSEKIKQHLYIDGKCTTCDICTETIESEHNYAKETDITTAITKDGAVKLEVTFSAETETEENYDFIYIYDGQDNLIGKYSGKQLASQTLCIDGDTVKIQLTSDRSSQKYGYYVTVTPISNIGDLDDNAVVNATDLTLARKAIIKSLIPATGDLNGDCLFNLKDFVRLKKILVYKA